MFNIKTTVFCLLPSALFPLLSVLCRLSSVFCLLSFTLVERTLQITPFYAKQTQS